MKFGESLSEGLVPEWKQQYLNYKEGKKLIKKIDELRSVVREDDSTMNPPTSIDAMPFTTRRNTSRSGKRDPNDRTPLLGPIEEDSGAVEELESIDPKDATPARGGASLSFQQHDQPQHETASHSNSVSDLRLKRRPSFFNYSIRSSSREKQEQQKSDFNSGKTDFINWVDKELIKVDKFYLEKELEAYERFLILQDQLYQLKEHKAEVLMARLKNAAGAKGIEITNPDTIYKVSEITRHTRGAIEALNRFELPSLPSTTFWKKWRKHHSHNHKHSTTDDIALGSKKSEETDYEFDVNYDQNRIRNGQELLEREDELDDANSMGLSIDSELPHSETAGDITGYTGATGMHPGTSHGSIDGEVASRTSVDSINSNIAAKRQARRDYVKKNNQFRVPYVYARRQLKTALLEHYRALTLLKSFRVLNRTALRKITKKFDKSSGSSISEDFMKKVDHSYFQTSDLVDKLMTQVEELYIVFFDPESTDRKHSLEKLKSIAYTMNSLDGRPVSFYLPTFSDGICIGFGIPLMVLGLYVALNKTLLGELPEGKLLLQIWGGFFC